MINKAAFSWATINKWLETRGDFHDIIKTYSGYCARFHGDPNAVFDGKTIFEALASAMKGLGGQYVLDTKICLLYNGPQRHSGCVCRHGERARHILVCLLQYMVD